MKVNLKINDQPVSVEAGSTILQAAEELEIRIPTLCHFQMDCFNLEHRNGSCRVCVVEVEGRPNLAPACSTPVTEGMVVHTNTLRAINARRTILDLLLSDHPKDCLTCPKNLNCQLQALAQELGLHHLLFKGEQSTYNRDLSSKAIARDLDKCIMCRRCETACGTVQTVGVLSGVGRGFRAVVAPAGLKPLAETECVFCGQCVQVCPVGALSEMDYKYPVWRALNDSTKTVVVQTAPAVRVAIGEAFGLEPGSISTGKTDQLLSRLGEVPGTPVPRTALHAVVGEITAADVRRDRHKLLRAEDRRRTEGSGGGLGDALPLEEIRGGPRRIQPQRRTRCRHCDLHPGTGGYDP